MFKRRATTLEHMDAPSFDREVADASFRFIALTNRWLGGVRVVRNFLKQQYMVTGKSSSFHVLDVGSGACDIPIAVSQTLGKNAPLPHFTCVERNSHTAEIARRNIRASRLPNIKLANQDIHDLKPEVRFDCAVASMIFHHLTPDQIDGMLDRIAELTKGPLLVSDLHRNIFSYSGCLLLALPYPREVRHDALLSIRKGFREADLNALEVHDKVATVNVRTSFPARVQAEISFRRDSTGASSSH